LAQQVDPEGPTINRFTNSLFGGGRLVLTPFAGRCRGGGPGGGLKVVTTLFPLSDWAQEIGGERANVSLLLPPGGG